MCEHYNHVPPTPQDEWRELKRLFRRFAIMMALLMIIMALCSSCSRRVVYDVQHTTDTVHHYTRITDTLVQQQVRVDSILRIDSVYLHEYTDGTTVHIDHYRDRILYRDRLRVDTLERLRFVTDTLYLHRTDTIMQRIQVAARITPWQSMRMRIGDVALIMMALASLVCGVLLAVRMRNR